ncbi:membrane protein [Virgisporangium aliadipatigenens]|uniref:Membrane protein n=1 Tax=Virgisporangium aliadipatigenens TaxID=741659 RepID=A0A8J3YMX6_9ACTN|nr:membrane protein [Virgisporangium aliadipatigenens]
MTVDRAEIDQRAADGDRAAKTVRRALRELSFQLSGAQLGITITALLTGYMAEPAISRLIEPVFGGVSDAVALAIATLLSMLFGELVPKNAALARPMPVARRTAGPQRMFSTAFKWLIAVLNGSANWLVRRFGVEPQEELASARSPEELGLLAAISAKAGELPTETAVMLQRTIRFGDKRAAEAMTPRVDVVGLRADDPITDLIELARRTGHSRFPVYVQTLDQVRGVVTVTDALGVPPAKRPTTTVAAVAREPVFLPESLDLDNVLAALQAADAGLAIVVDEYGGTDGVVTVEDLVEELVGEIDDEHDPVEITHELYLPDPSGTPSTEPVLVSGVLREDELFEMTGFRLPAGPFETLAGFLMARLGHIPSPGETVREGNWELTVIEIERRRVEQVRVVRHVPEAGDE